MSAPVVRLKVPGSLHGTPLQAFIVRRTGYSGKRVKSLLDARSVFVNGRRIWMGKHPLQAGDEIEFRRPEEASSYERREPLRPAILWADERYRIVNKLAGMLSEGDHGVEGTGETHYWAVHRLDRDTSGCLILAAQKSDREAMIPLFQDRAVEKRYHALVVGRFPRSLTRITHTIDGQPAVTRIVRVYPGEKISLLELLIETGRTHQIRRHLASAHFPVLGDKQYGSGWESDPDLRAVPRQMLHASRIAFTHPLTGKPVAAEAPWPADFMQWTRRARVGVEKAPKFFAHPGRSNDQTPDKTAVSPKAPTQI